MKDFLSKLKNSISKILYNSKENNQHTRKRFFYKSISNQRGKSPRNKDKDNYPPETIYPLW